MFGQLVPNDQGFQITIEKKSIGSCKSPWRQIWIYPP